MGKRLTYDDRVFIYNMLHQGKSVQDIAKWVGVHRATISREINEKTNSFGQYDPDYAQALYDNRNTRKDRTQLDFEPGKAEYIADLILNNDMSPEEVSSFIKKNKKYKPASTKNIYRLIEKGLIPGVTKDSLKLIKHKVFSNGTICFPRWVVQQLEIRDGDIFEIDINDNNEIIIRLNKEIQ